jgi:hypothetical protein
LRVKGLPIQRLLETEPGALGPEELQDIARAFDAVLKDLGLSDRKDPAALMVAKLTIELAKNGEFTVASSRDRVLKEMKPKGRPN